MKLFSGRGIKNWLPKYCTVILPGTAGKLLRNFLLWVTFVEMRRKMYSMLAGPVSPRYNRHHSEPTTQFKFQMRFRKDNGLCNIR